jgi:digeranylgeranylglycerophospholipid reductase
VIEKRQEVGAPVRCGEGLGEVWMEKSGLKPDPAYCYAEMHGAAVYSPKGRRIAIHTKNKGWVIERKVFEKKLAQQAIREGARYLMKSRVYDVIKENGFVTGVRVETPEGNFDIKAKLVIAVDGVDSMVAKYAGINTANPLSEVDSGYEYEMSGLKLPDKDLIGLYVGNKIAPRGYVWIFPKGPDTANVGIGIGGNNEKTAKYYLDMFIEAHPEIFSGAGILEIKGGCCPVGMPLEKPYADGLLIVGDAAHMVNAIHGGGMGTSMEAAVLAARTAKEAIGKGDVSAKFFKKYADAWFEQRGNQLKDVVKVRRFFEKLSDDDLEALADFFTPEQILEFADGRKLTTFLKLLAKNPRVALVAAMTLR